jgi:hypothetical protein
MFRMSLRGMLILVALFAIAITSLVYANDFWVSIVTGIVMLIFTAALIVAFVDRGFRQAFAIGFVLTVCAYAVLVLSGINSPGVGNSQLRNAELDPWEGRLPTTRVLRVIHGVVERGGYFDPATGMPVPNYKPNTTSGGMGGFGGGGMFGGPTYREIPPREKFMPIGHCWWTLLLGSIGGLFAMHLYRRRMHNEEKLPADVS